ncbi:unnamed protein product [Phaeothamnion confervicola]
MAAPDQRYDELLATMAGQLGGLEPLMRAFFSFLHRRTDFYVQWDPQLAQAAKPEMGFATGVAEKILLCAFHSFPMKDYTQSTPGAAVGRPKATAKPQASFKPARATPRQPAMDTAGFAVPSPPAVIAAAALPNRAAAKASSSNGTGGASLEGASTSGGDGGGCVGGGGGDEGCGGGSGCGVTSSAARGASSRVVITADGKQVPVGNGGVTDRYYWTQTLDETTVYVNVPPGTRGKDVRCDIGPRHLRLMVTGQPSGQTSVAAMVTAARETALSSAGAASAGDAAGASTAAAAAAAGAPAVVLLDGELGGVVSAEESVWSVESGDTVVIVLDKKGARTWWKSVLQASCKAVRPIGRALFNRSLVFFDTTAFAVSGMAGSLSRCICAPSLPFRKTSPAGSTFRKRGDCEIDTTKVDSTQTIDEYDEETQGAIRKIMVRLPAPAIEAGFRLPPVIAVGVPDVAAPTVVPAGH